jgi:phosphomethylpyrimidine synthase
MSSARRGIATEEMITVAKEEISLDNIIHKVANGSIIIPNNNSRKQKKIKTTGISYTSITFGLT